MDNNYICNIVINHSRVNANAGLFEVGLLESFLSDILRLVYELEVDDLSIYSELICGLYNEKRESFIKRDIFLSVEVANNEVQSVSIEACRLEEDCKDFDVRCHCIKIVDSDDFNDYGFFDLSVSKEFKCIKK